MFPPTWQGRKVGKPGTERARHSSAAQLQIRDLHTDVGVERVDVGLCVATERRKGSCRGVGNRSADAFAGGEIRCYLRKPGFGRRLKLRDAQSFHLGEGALGDVPERESSGLKYLLDVITDLVLEVTDVSRPSDGKRAVRKEKDKEHLAKSSAGGATIKLVDLIDNCVGIAEHDKGFAPVYLREAEALLPVLKHGDERLWERARDTLAAAMSKNWHRDLSMML